jgi:glutaminyl-peptide cyclotransferase
MLNDYFCPMKIKWLLLLALCAVYMSSCNNTGPAPGSSGDSSSTNTPVISYSIVASYPHDTSSFTEGLEFYKGKLLESTGNGNGNKGKSKLIEADLQTGKSFKNISLDPKFFGEGLTVFNDTLYQLTWQEHIVHIYSVKDFKKIKEVSFSRDGWGLTNDGKSLIASDGSSNLYFYEPVTLRLLKTQLITEGGSPAVNINELEYINGYVYANQWQYNYIIKIDPNSGQVVGKLDLTDLVNKVKGQAPYINELNGIAYNPKTKKFYVTGKNWPQIFELQIAL